MTERPPRSELSNAAAFPVGVTTVTNPDGTTHEVAILAVDGRHTSVDVDGARVLIELIETKIETRLRKKDGGATIYAILQTPSGGSLRLRYDTTVEDRSNNVNHAENLRPFAPGTDRYHELYRYRPTSESVNALNGRLASGTARTATPEGVSRRTCWASRFSTTPGGIHNRRRLAGGVSPHPLDRQG